MNKQLTELLNDNKQYQLHIINKYMDYTPLIVEQMQHDYNKPLSETWTVADNYAIKCLTKYIKRL